MSQKKVQQYILYALGEILLVVIGILIALQINNWREDHKRRKLEVNILKEIKANLEEDQRINLQRLAWGESIVNSSKILLAHMRADLPYHDSLATHFSNLQLLTAAPFDVVRTGYERMTSTGSEIITNDSIRTHLSDYYDLRYSLIERLTNKHLYDFGLDSKNLLLKNLDFYSDQNRAIPIDFEALKKNTEFTSNLDVSLTMYGTTLGYLESYMEQNLAAQTLITKEIERP